MAKRYMFKTVALVTMPVVVEAETEAEAIEAFNVRDLGTYADDIAASPTDPFNIILVVGIEEIEEEVTDDGSAAGA